MAPDPSSQLHTTLVQSQHVKQFPGSQSPLPTLDEKQESQEEQQGSQQLLGIFHSLRNRQLSLNSQQRQQQQQQQQQLPLETNTTSAALASQLQSLLAQRDAQVPASKEDTQGNVDPSNQAVQNAANLLGLFKTLLDREIPSHQNKN
jgi:hypothetical protein